MNNDMGSPHTTLRWRKSSYSTGDGSGNECVELAPLPDGGRAIRDSKLGENSGILATTPTAWSAFLTEIKTEQLTLP
jgi:hypothetical protein